MRSAQGKHRNLIGNLLINDALCIAVSLGCIYQVLNYPLIKRQPVADGCCLLEFELIKSPGQPHIPGYLRIFCCREIVPDNPRGDQCIEPYRKPCDKRKARD